LVDGTGECDAAEPRPCELLLFVRARPCELTDEDEPDASPREYGGCGVRAQSCCACGGGDSECADCCREGRR
jgi:hypothetical protein